MPPLPKNIRQAWDNRDQTVIMATVSDAGAPNINYGVRAELCGEDTLVVADNHFGKTRKNSMTGCKGAILFRDRQGRVFQIKGSMEYHQEGRFFDFMKSWNGPDNPGHGAAVLKIEEVYSAVFKAG